MRQSLPHADTLMACLRSVEFRSLKGAVRGDFGQRPTAPRLYGAPIEESVGAAHAGPARTGLNMESSASRL